MTEIQNEGEGSVSGATGSPNQDVSQTEKKPLDGDAIKLLTELKGGYDTLVKELRGLQGRQDRNDKNVTDFQGQLARFNQVKAQGNLSDEQALAEMQRVDGESQWKISLEKRLDDIAGRLGGIGSTPTEQQMVAEVLNEYKLDPKDAFVAAQFKGKTFANRTEAELAAARVFRDKQLSPNPNSAQSASQAGGISAGDENNEEIYARIAELSKNRTQNRAEIDTLLKQVGMKT